MSKHYNTPCRTRTIKTRVTEEEHADFMERLTAYGMNQSEFIRQAITGATVKPILDENGRPAPREDYRIATLNCGGEDFAVPCMRVNLTMGRTSRGTM